MGKYIKIPGYVLFAVAAAHFGRFINDAFGGLEEMLSLDNLRNVVTIVVTGALGYGLLKLGNHLIAREKRTTPEGS